MAKRPRGDEPARVVLGSSDLEVSVVCLGTMTMGRMNDEATSFAILDRYVVRVWDQSATLVHA